MAATIDLNRSDTQTAISPTDTPENDRNEFWRKSPSLFPPGVSGNPGGRPRYATISRACREELDKVDEKTGLTGAQLIARALVREAVRGNVWAARELREVTEGKRPRFVQTEIIEQQRNLEGGDSKQRLLAKLCMRQEIT
jgi:hypothetical protein